MSTVLDMATIAALIGDPARANIMCALLDGRAHTAGELAYAARVSPQTASGHLAKLAAARLILSSAQGRHRYYHLAGAHVARMLESITTVAAVSLPRMRPIRIDPGMVTARLCYDHLAGKLGVAIADCLCGQGHLALSEDGGEVTPSGAKFFCDFGIDLDDIGRSRRNFCRPCIDWSERRPHIAGALGAALARRMLALKWVERVRDGRALTITPTGKRGLTQTFGLPLGEKADDRLRRPSAPAAALRA